MVIKKERKAKTVYIAFYVQDGEITDLEWYDNIKETNSYQYYIAVEIEDVVPRKSKLAGHIKLSAV